MGLIGDLSFTIFLKDLDEGPSSNANLLLLFSKPDKLDTLR